MTGQFALDLGDRGLSLSDYPVIFLRTAPADCSTIHVFDQRKDLFVC